jgi:YidC/Oxa1 family membrane protein insertase
LSTVTTLPLANILQPLIDAFDAVIVFFHDTAGLSWGLSIIALTCTVRALLLPLAFKQFHSMQALQIHAPELKKIQERYKDDRERLNQEMMKFYKENKVNPFASCLPLLAQLPVFFALFYMLRHDLRVDICGQAAEPCGDAAAWFFIPDLTDKATGAVLVTLMVLYAGSQLVSSLMMLTAATDKTQRTIMLALPFVFLPFIIGFPAGLMVYWITTNVWTMGQQWALRKTAGYTGWRANEPPEHLRAARQAAKPATARAGAPTRRSRATEQPDGDGAVSAAGRGGGKDGGPEGATDGAQAGAAREGRATRAAAPPPPPRKKKKRSGRRR